MGNIAIIGTGYVGLTTGACLAHLGHDVICADVDAAKVERLSRGEIPILEAGLDELVHEGRRSGPAALRARRGQRPRRSASSCTSCVPTPQGADGSADLTYIEAAAREIAPTSPPTPSWSTSRRCRSARPAWSSTRWVGATSTWCPTPSSSARASAVHDFLHPDRVVIGSDDQGAAIRVASLYIGVAGSVDGDRPGLGRDHQVRQQRVPGHQALVRERHRRAVRGRGCRCQRRRARHGLRQAHRPRVPAARPGLGRQLLPQGRAGPHVHRPARPATSSTCSTAWSASTGSSSTAPPTRWWPWPVAASRVEPSACGGSPSRPAPTTCASRRRCASSSAWWPWARWCGPSTRR